MRTLKILTTCLVISLFLSSCQKGAAGPAGTNGTNGVSDISSTTYTITTSSWSAASSGFGFISNISDASISNAGTDGIEVFIQISAGTYLGLSAINVITKGDEEEFNYSNGAVTLYYEYTSAPSSSQTCKVVVIPPSVMKQHPNTNWNDYNQIQVVMAEEKALSTK